MDVPESLIARGCAYEATPEKRLEGGKPQARRQAPVALTLSGRLAQTILLLPLQWNP